MFKRNEGMLDRFVRVVLGLLFLPAGLVWLGLLQGGVPAGLAAGFGVLMLVTGVSGVCLMYIPFGISTLEKEKELVDKCRSMAAACACGLRRDTRPAHEPDPQTTAENA